MNKIINLSKYLAVFWLGYMIGIEFQDWHEETFGTDKGSLFDPEMRHS